MRYTKQVIKLYGEDALNEWYDNNVVYAFVDDKIVPMGKIVESVVPLPYKTEINEDKYNQGDSSTAKTETTDVLYIVTYFQEKI